MLSQGEFNGFVEDYNSDYIYLLDRAGTGNYNCLITSSRILKDLYDMIITLQKKTKLDFEIVPHPFTLRGSEELFTQLGFETKQIDNIQGFLAFVRDVYGKEFEECMEEERPFLCEKK